MEKRLTKFIPFLLLSLAVSAVNVKAQEEKKEIPYKNVIRYNLSGPLLTGFGRYIVFGYERIVNQNQSFSINAGPIALAKSLRENVSTEDFTFRNDPKSTGFNVSLDYRFYLRKENKYGPPRGLYVGPYISYNQFNRESVWSNDSTTSSDKSLTTKLNIKIFTIGAELGYQLVLWKRFAIDFLMVGPGIGNYSIDLKTQGNLTDEEKKKLGEAVKQVVSEKLPGFSYVLSNKYFSPEGKIRTWTIGYRYIIHLGFLF